MHQRFSCVYIARLQTFYFIAIGGRDHSHGASQTSHSLQQKFSTLLLYSLLQGSKARRFNASYDHFSAMVLQ
jgi:hypothetical protein